VSALLAMASLLHRDGTRAAGACNVASGQPVTVRRFAELAAAAAGASPALLGFGDIPMRPDDVPWLVGNSQRLRTRASWAPAFDLQQGLAVTLARRAPNAPS
jgi:nucleoside-diphosphate-sugar epimerase